MSLLMETDEFVILAFKWVDCFKELSALSHRVAVDKGFYENQPEDGTLIALMHSELSEALEQLREDPAGKSKKIPPYTAVEEELADVIIRIMDFSKARGLYVGNALIEKMLYNEKRPHKHGKKF